MTYNVHNSIESILIRLLESLKRLASVINPIKNTGIKFIQYLENPVPAKT